MADKLIKPIGVRLDEPTYEYYSQLAADDDRDMASYIRRILQKVKEKDLIDTILSKEQSGKGG